MKRKFCRVAPFFLCLLVCARTASAVSLGQFDTFQDGTTQGWTNGGLAPPVTNISTGGPAGVNDRFIRVNADGNGAGGRLTTFEFIRWTGDYIAAGITTIELDLRNQGSTALSIRLGFEVDLIQSAPGYLSAPMLLPVGSGWQHFSISIAEANMIVVGNPGPYNIFFSNVAELRIIHEVGTSNLNGDPIVGQLGIDNIHAVPEPTVTVFGAIALLGFAVRYGRGKCRADS